MHIQDITERARASAPELHPPHQRVLLGEDPSCGYRGIVAVHSTALGPAVGGTRLWSYPSLDEALRDALRLSRGMTYKNALAGLPLGGGKSVILGGPALADRQALLRAHARLVHALGGEYVTAEDVGTTPADMDVIRGETPYVAGLTSGLGDPSPFTARGVFRAMLAAAAHRWGAPELRGVHVVVQGAGSVGSHLARELAAAGARLTVADVDPARARRVAEECGAEVVAPERVLDVAAQVLAPCALGGVIDDRALPRLRVEVVAGAANNQLASEVHGDRLHARGVLYVPDYAANAGGVIAGALDLLGWEMARVRRGVEAIYDTVETLLTRALADGQPPHRIADRQVEERLGAAG